MSRMRVLVCITTLAAIGACTRLRAPSDASAPHDAGMADCCTDFNADCGCYMLGGDTRTVETFNVWIDGDARVTQGPFELEEDLADADWHLLPDGTREVVRTNHAMTEVWVNVDIAKVHLVHDDGGEAQCR